MAANFSQVQRAVQKQALKLSQVQIQSLKYLELNALDLRGEIYSEVEKNPALEITGDRMEDGSFSVRTNGGPLSDNTKMGSESSSGEQKSRAFQEALESKADNRETLSAHLLSQFNLVSLPENQVLLGTKLIQNLDKSGCHILAPETFLLPGDTRDDLKKCLEVIQNLDPVGCCVKNFSESLLVQAKIKGNASDAALFILDGHFDFLNPPVPEKILKRIKNFVEEEKKKAFSKQSYDSLLALTEDDILASVEFIKTLDPKPARDFSQDENVYVIPEVKVEKILIKDVKPGDQETVVEIPGDEEFCFRLKMDDFYLPALSLSSDYVSIEKDKSVPDSAKDSIRSGIQNARMFMDMLEYRRQLIFFATREIVRSQVEFFRDGPGHLAVLSQKDISERLEVHESTISRMANSKFLDCEWGVYPVKYFFTSGISQSSKTENFPETNSTQEQKNISPVEQNKGAVSKDRVVFELKKIIESTPPGAKPLSDRKISELLLSMGIKVARRTIAKYRYQLNLGSSYERKK